MAPPERRQVLRLGERRDRPDVGAARLHRRGRLAHARREAEGRRGGQQRESGGDCSSHRWRISYVRHMK